MNIIRNLKNKYAIYCPICKEELYWNSSFKNTDILECKTCRLYFKYKGNRKRLIIDENHINIINDLKDSMKGNYVESYNKTSDYYSPEWLKKLIRKK